jgi:hypothetical protein
MAVAIDSVFIVVDGFDSLNAPCIRDDSSLPARLPKSCFPHPSTKRHKWSEFAYLADGHTFT